VYRFSYKICRDREKASETLQDTFINVFRKLKSFDGKAKFSTWLYTIVTNNCLMKHRKRKSDELEESLEAYDHPPHAEHANARPELVSKMDSPADVVIGKELRELLESAMMKLPEDYRVVFVMRDVEGTVERKTAGILNSLSRRPSPASACPGVSPGSAAPLCYCSSGARPMKCDTVYLHICDHLDEDIASPRCRQIKQHLDECPNCRAYLDSLKKTIVLSCDARAEGLLQAHRELFKTIANLTRSRRPATASKRRAARKT
jgi:RNA polymerase sigma factor (sigma-70 family)